LIQYPALARQTIGFSQDYILEKNTTKKYQALVLYGLLRGPWHINGNQPDYFRKYKV
jgi:hypothetical protein